MSVPAVIVAGTHSGAGKTTATLAILAALIRRGRVVQAYKVGPDFIDPAHHARVTGRPGRNLDTWMMGPDALAASFRSGSEGADLAVIEGVMGLFDGRGPRDEAGSAADLARRWALPVVLVVDASGLARSIAPLARGFASFDEAVRVVGVVANRVGGDRHYRDYLAPALEDAGGVEPLGYLARDESLAVPSRHLGLWMPDDLHPGSLRFDALADAAEATIDLDRIETLARPPVLPRRVEPAAPSDRLRRTVAVAIDRAFCFYYEDNLDLLRSSGGVLVPFSPLEDEALPDGAEMILLGGGYPELHADQLAANGPMRDAIRRFHAEGGPILAECGGMMACCAELRDREGRTFPLWDLIPARAVMHDRRAALGYVTIVTHGLTRLGPPGTSLRGHEFHYSSLEPFGPLPHVTSLRRPDRAPVPDGIQVGGLLAGYAHAHFGSNPEAARRWIVGS